MQVIETIKGIREQVAAWRQQKQIVAVVPTMGNLHAGHISLVELAKQHADHVIVSIFVNPLQFAPDEDFAEYPRTLANDLEQCESVGVSVVFTPSEMELYPEGRENLTQVIPPTHLNSILCSQSRPHFFAGVATVVTKLLQIVQPDIAVLGKKDYQQGVVVSQMVRDLNMPLKIIMAETQREANGLAMSSRNQYLSAAERQTAGQLSTYLQTIKQAILTDWRNYPQIIKAATVELTTMGFAVDYIDIRQQTLAEPDESSRQLVILVAAKLGKTRLIDNLEVEI